jgi:hypothetical protein
MARIKISELPELDVATLDTTYIAGVYDNTTFKIPINRLTSSLDTTFASDLVVNAVSGTINTLATTASFNALSTSVDSRLDILEGFSSSADNRYVLSGSITQTTWDNIANKPNDIVSSSTQISDLGFVTGSYTTLNSFNNLTQSFNQISQSFTSISGSFGSIDFSGINAVTESYLSFTQSYYSASSSFDSKILTEKNRIDAILSASNTNTDTFAEIVTLINSVDLTNDNAFASFYTASNTRLTSLENATSSYTTDSASFNSRIISGSAVAGTISSSAQITAFGFISSSTTINTGSLDLIGFNTSAGVSVGVGQLAWNNTDGTLDLGMKGGNVVQQIGQEIFYEVRNETGIQIPNGTAVYANGVTAGSGRITAAPYVADGSIREVRFLGIATENITSGVNGFITHFGYVRDLDTRGTTASSIAVGDETWSVGDILYVHPTIAGKLTKVKPQHEVTAAIIITRHQSSGVIFVRPSSAGHLEDIHDILINTGSLSNGQVLSYNSTSGLWVNANTISGSSQLTSSFDSRYVQTGSFNTLSSSVDSRLDILEATIISGSPNYTQVLGNRRTSINSVGTSIISGSITTTGNPVQIMVTGDANPIGGVAFGRIQIFRDSNPIGAIVQVENSANLNVPYCLNVIDTPSAGTYVYSMRLVDSMSGTFDFGEASGPLLTAVELRTNIKTSNFATTGSNSFNGNQTITGSVTTTGVLNVGTVGSGDEGGEIQLVVPQTNTSLTNKVIVDVFQNRLRFWEGGPDSKGVYIDLSKAPAGNAGELMWKASGMVGAGTFVTLDNLKCTVTTSSNRGLSIGAVSTTFEADLSGWYAASVGSAGGSTNNISYTTTASTSLFNWNFIAHGDTAHYHIRDKTNDRFYRVTMMIGASYISNFISIERLF